MGRERVMALLACYAWVGLSAPAALGDEPHKSAELPFKFELRLRSELRGNYDLSGARDDYNTPLLQRVRLMFAPRWKAMSFVIQAQDSSVWVRDKSPYSPANTHLYQLYLEIPAPFGFRLKAGRQELIVGEERLVGAFGWDNRGRIFDAVSLGRKLGKGSLQAFAANLAAPRQHNFARGQNLIGFAWKRPGKENSVEVYSFWLHDQRVTQGEERPGRTRIVTSGTRVTRQRGKLKQNVEGAWQAGKRAHDTHLAGALTYRVDYTVNGTWKPSVGAEYSFATGDGDAKDGESHEFNNLYPTNHPFYGYMDLFGWRNLHNPRVILALQPLKSLRLEANYHDFWLAQRRGAWKDAGGRLLGQDTAGRAGRRVGGETDLIAVVTFSSHWRFTLGYSGFVPGEFAKAVRGPDAAKFGYFQLLCSY